jgi:hypothetical protein
MKTKLAQESFNIVVSCRVVLDGSVSR